MLNLNPIRIILIVTIAFFCTDTAFAVVVPGLYQATVPVTGNGASAQNAAATAALPQVLIKVSGNANVVQVPAIAAKMANASNYVQQFALVQSSGSANNPPAPAAATPVASATPAPTQPQLKIQFDPNAINQLLQQANQPVWNENRPLAMIWLSVDRGNGPALIGSSTADDLPAVITAEAAKRGLPTILPVLDLQDLTAVTVNDVVSDATGVVQAASSRYGSDVEVIGRITPLGNNQWNGAWTLIFNDQSTPQVDWNSTNSDINQLVIAMVDNVTNTLAAHYATAPSKTTSLTKVRMMISNVNGLSAYANVMDYLNGLGPVKQAQVVQVDGSHVEVELLVDGGVNALTQAIALDNKLTSVVAPGEIVGQPSTQPQQQPEAGTDQIPVPVPTTPTDTSAMQQASQMFNAAKDSVKKMIKPGSQPQPAAPTVTELQYQWAG